MEKMRKEYLKTCENSHKSLYIHANKIGVSRNQLKIEDLIKTAKFTMFGMGGEPLVTLKAVGGSAV